MDIKNATATTLRAVEKDERWLQEWLVQDPKRLGIGNVVIKSKELRHYTGKGGRLDILAYNAALDTYYEIEVMLGECDADHVAESIPQGGERGRTRSRLRLSADGLDSSKGHLVRRGLRQLQRANGADRRRASG